MKLIISSILPSEVQRNWHGLSGKLADYHWFTYKGPMIRKPGFFLMQHMDFGVKPGSNGKILFFDTLKGKFLTIDLALAKKIAQFSKLIKGTGPGGAQTKTGGHPEWFLNGIHSWFLGKPVTEQRFFNYIAKWDTGSIASGWRATLIDKAAIGSRVKLGNKLFYSGSSKLSTAVEGWTSWAEVNRKLEGYSDKVLSIIEFTSPKIYANTKKLYDLAVESETNKRIAVSDAALSFKEIWIAGGQTGKIVKQIPVKRLMNR